MVVTSSLRIRIPPEGNGLRVDHLLAVLVPELGLRGRRRLCGAGRVLLDGRPADAAAKARAGQELALIPAAAGERSGLAEAGELGGADTARLVGQGAGLAALYKPAGLHSALLKGGGGPSLEADLEMLVGGRGVVGPADSFPKLLNRLDAGTSGLVLAAVTAAGERLWREAEADGVVDKRYLALVVGHPPGDFKVRAALDMARRTRVRTLRHEAEAVRHTEVRVLARFTRAAAPALERYASARARRVGENGAAMPQGQEALALVGCRIRKGARHQIRAHLASAGYPLWGDTLYGTAGGLFFLHHGLCRLPGFHAACPPPWEHCLPLEAVARARAWLTPEDEVSGSQRS